MTKRTTLFPFLAGVSLATLTFTGCGDKKEDAAPAPKHEVHVQYSAYGLATPTDEKIDVGGYITIREMPQGGTSTASTEKFSTGWNSAAYADRPLDAVVRPGDKVSLTIGCSKVRTNNTIRLSNNALVEAAIEVDGKEVKKVVFNNKTSFTAEGEQAVTIDFTL
ncbi:hypothetical protein E5K00_15040 [Hymenobacter aquaticus]|uniref:Lipoprotein n=1 Tax=Hymenobacter aquaticus TaxID=1867101 RepID=A0A4Z0PXG6_9BACT|nr:hypothetical protein [Hymenobacter aquaticus]TGE21593.1 hypothetical protein E5K00_15040 [Hymenobacter aquaticus]